MVWALCVASPKPQNPGKVYSFCVILPCSARRPARAAEHARERCLEVAHIASNGRHGSRFVFVGQLKAQLLLCIRVFLLSLQCLGWIRNVLWELLKRGLLTRSAAEGQSESSVVLSFVRLDLFDLFGWNRRVLHVSLFVVEEVVFLFGYVAEWLIL